MDSARSGQTIVEVIVATGILALVLTAIVAGLALSVKNTAQSKFKALSSKLAQEGIESIRKFRDQLGWDTFYTILNNQGSGFYCLNTLPADVDSFQNLELGVCDSGFAVVGSEFEREAYIDIISADEISIEMTVSWDDAGTTREALINQEFKNWK